MPLTLDSSLCFKPPSEDNVGTARSELSPLPIPSVLRGCRWGEAMHPVFPGPRFQQLTPCSALSENRKNKWVSLSCGAGFKNWGAPLPFHTGRAVAVLSQSQRLPAQRRF